LERVKDEIKGKKKNKEEIMGDDKVKEDNKGL